MAIARSPSMSARRPCETNAFPDKEPTFRAPEHTPFGAELDWARSPSAPGSPCSALCSSGRRLLTKDLSNAIQQSGTHGTPRPPTKPPSRPPRRGGAVAVSPRPAPGAAAAGVGERAGAPARLAAPAGELPSARAGARRLHRDARSAAAARLHRAHHAPDLARLVPARRRDGAARAAGRPGRARLRQRPPHRRGLGGRVRGRRAARARRRRGQAAGDDDAAERDPLSHARRLPRLRRGADGGGGAPRRPPRRARRPAQPRPPTDDHLEPDAASPNRKERAMSDDKAKRPPQTHEIEIDAPPEAVWKAISSGEELTRWYAEEARVEPRAGGENWVSWGEGQEVGNQNLKWEPGRRLTVGKPGHETATDWNAIVVDFEIETRGGRTVLKLVQSGLPAGPDWDSMDEGTDVGWEMFLFALKFYLERHAGKPRRTILRYWASSRPAGETFAALCELVGIAADDRRAGARYTATTAGGEKIGGEILAVEPG